jgi:CheY-like chemotaxis protein
VLRVLIVDSVVEHADMIVSFLHASDAWPAIDLRQADSYDAALRAFDVSVFDIAFFDYRLGQHDGLALLREIRTRGVETPGDSHESRRRRRGG